MRVNKGTSAPNGQTVKQVNLKRVAVAFLLATAGLVVFTLASAHTYQEKQRQQLNQTLQEKVELQKVLDKNKLDSEKNQQEIERLKKELQAKKDGQARALAESARVSNVQPSYTPSGTKDEWLSASGIPSSLWGYVDWLVSRESGWKPCAYNPGRNDCNANPSSACGLVQQYPCHKIPGDWRDPVAALKWQYNYVTVRYGGYPQAVAYWQAHGNY